MNNSSPKKMYPRPFNFTTSIENFVFGSSWQESSKRKASPPIETIPSPKHQYSSLFDRYNRNNLMLRACDLTDVQILSKNPIAYQENIAVKSASPNPNRKKTNINQTQLNQEKEQSNEAKLNEFLFNFRAREEDKKTKKKKFLDDVEVKLLLLEKQAEELQNHKAKEAIQIKQIIGINTKITQDVERGQLMGKLNSAINQSSPSKNQVQIRRLKDEMSNYEMNLIIQQQQQYNQNLLQQIEEVTKQKLKSSPSRQFGKSIGKGKLGKTGNTVGSLSKTLKRSNQPGKPSQKKLRETWKQKKK